MPHKAYESRKSQWSCSCIASDTPIMKRFVLPFGGIFYMQFVKCNVRGEL